MSIVSDSRCPSCAAAVRPDDAWCTLCYADLRAPEPQPEPEPQLVQDVVYDPLDASVFATTAGQALETASYSLPMGFATDTPQPMPAVDPNDPLGLGVAPAVPVQPQQNRDLAPPFVPQWSCAHCGGVQTYDDLTCHKCGKALLGDDSPSVPTLVKPGNKASKLTVIFGGMAAVTVVLLIISTVLGMLF